MNKNLDEITQQMKPSKQFIDEYLSLKYGMKSEYKYFVRWYLVDDTFKLLHSQEFVDKYKGQICVYLERPPYNKRSMCTDTATVIFANDYRMKQLYQEGVIGKIDWLYDETLTTEEKQKYATGEIQNKWEWPDET